jgi:hypothetical protein
MKNLFIVVALMITLAANSQARLNKPAKEIYNEFELDGIEYINDSEVGLYLSFYPDSNVLVNYYLDADSICTSVSIQTFTQEMTNFIIDNYNKKGYLKVEDGWLMRGSGVIFKIVHQINEDNSNLFFWY